MKKKTFDPYRMLGGPVKQQCATCKFDDRGFFGFMLLFPDANQRKTNLEYGKYQDFARKYHCPDYVRKPSLKGIA